MLQKTITLTDEDKKNLKEFWRVYENNSKKIQEELFQEAQKIPEFAPILNSITDDQRTTQNKKSHSLQQKAILNDAWEAFLKFQYDQGISYAKLGITFSGWFKLISAFKYSFLKNIDITTFEKFKNFVSVIEGMVKFVDITMGIVGDAYIETKEAIIKAQEEAISELSTPILQLREKLLILPIIGVIDTHRARQITQNLLSTIKAVKAKIVVMDITGVPIVDSKVDNHLVQTAHAVRLMGGRVIITGISPEIAQTMVTIGADLQEISTAGSLEDGIKEADRYLGHKISTKRNYTGLN